MTARNYISGRGAPRAVLPHGAFGASQGAGCGGLNQHLTPVACGWPGPTNTGFDGVNAAGGPLTVGQLTPVTGTQVTTADGQVIDGLDITVGTGTSSDTGLTGIQVNHGTLANPVIIKRCRIRLRPWDPFDGVNGSGGCGMLKVAVGKYVTIQDCELFSDLGTTGCNTTSPGCCNDSTGITCTDALVHVTANRLKVHNGSGIVEHTDGITLTDCYFYNLICGCTPAPCQHSQAVACRNVNNVHLEHCFLDGRNAGTALFFVQHQSQWCQNLSMNNCLGWLDKASTYYLFQDSLQFTSCPPGGGNFVITNNRFQFDNRSPTDIQNFSFDCPGTTWSNNVWDDTGATIAAPF